jgi:6-phosphogluconate dehydrogenase
MTPPAQFGLTGLAVMGANLARNIARHDIPIVVHNRTTARTFSSALAWYDGFRRERGPANLVQGLRDFFGAHTYRRVDREGVFHIRWGQDGREVRTDA